MSEKVLEENSENSMAEINNIKNKIEDLEKRMQNLEISLELPEELKQYDSEEKVGSVDEEFEESRQSQECDSKFGVGFFFSFVSLIGLILGLFLYKEGSYERKTFIKGWLIGFVTSIVIGIIIGIIYYVTTMNAINDMIDSYLIVY